MSIEVAAPRVQHGRRFGVRVNQIVATQVALVLVLLGALHSGPALAAAAICSAGVLALTWVRARGRWAFGWFGTLVSFTARRRTAKIDGPPAVLDFCAPRTVVTTADLAGKPVALLVDEFGLTMLFEVGDPSAEPPPLPPLAALLHAAEADQPPARLQLVLTGAPAPPGRAGTGPAASSYRALCEGSSLGHHSVVLAIRVLRSGGRSEEELRRDLLALGRRLTRKLKRLPVRPLDATAAVRAIAESAHAGEAGTAHEAWSALRLGGLTQATFRCSPPAGGTLPGHLVSRLLHLPAAATTVAVTTELQSGQATGLLVRIAAADTIGLGTAVQALHRLLTAKSVSVRRWDGTHLPGLAGTLPLGGWMEDEESFAFAELPAVPAGLVLGRNRHGHPLQARLFRPDPTLVLLVGGLPGAQLLAFRAMAAGARVVIHSTRPQAWEPFVRGAASPGDSITVIPPNRPLALPAGSPLRPTLTIVDGAQADATHPDSTDSAGSAALARSPSPAGSARPEGGRWQTTLVVWDAVRPADLETVTRADLLLLQPLEAAEAALLDGALHLGETAVNLTRMRPDMIAVVDRRTVRWAALAQSQIEAGLIGDPARAAPEVAGAAQQPAAGF
ncbi:type VII secretion protein EccE [Actinoplanes sp. NBC_00393]|uniref:type VII secretion protein EccE n=1 Tax=Actinoplanes sp. NBC_00393 TaxID=2975953 RepID=UPI002E1C7E95